MPDRVGRRRMLFVDDDPLILAGQRRLLREWRDTWDMTFVLGGMAALDALAASAEHDPFDVVVTDMRMPGCDGAALLQQVMERWPGTVRIVLSGQTELTGAMRAAHVAHRFLAKPCKTDTLYTVVECACRLMPMLTDGPMRATVAGVGMLPSLPAVHEELARALSRTDVESTEVARILATDGAMAAKVLQLVNSSFFGMPHAVASLEQATNYLSAEVLGSFVRSLDLSSAAAMAPLAPGFSLDAHHRHARCTAALVREMLTDRALVEDASVAALLHNIGDLLLAARDPAFYAAVSVHAVQRGLSRAHAEFELRGVTHAVAGACLLSLWGVPSRVVDAVLWHHTPRLAGSTSLDVPGAVHIADALMSEALDDAGSATPALLDPAYVAAIGATDCLSTWRVAARHIGTMARAGTGVHPC